MMQNRTRRLTVRDSPSRAAKPATEKGESVAPLKTSVFLVIEGVPVAKPRQTRSDKWNQRPCVMKYRKWADEARRILKAKTGIERLLGASKVDATFYFPMPAGWSRKKKAEMRGMPHRQKPDCDNCAKSVMDALIVNDETVYRATVYKEWCLTEREAGKVEVIIHP
jgi:Holliday junction resolvase RusA-like endonuclease